MNSDRHEVGGSVTSNPGLADRSEGSNQALDDNLTKSPHPNEQTCLSKGTGSAFKGANRGEYMRHFSKFSIFDIFAEKLILWCVF